MSTNDFRQSTLDKIDAVNTWIVGSLLPPDPALSSCLAANAAANLDAIDVAPNEGKMLYLFAKMTSAHRVLEIGTLSGYSAIWFAKAVGPGGGKVVTLEVNPNNASIAAKNIAAAGFGGAVEIKVAPALESLKKMDEENVEKFDIVFVDADKVNNLQYAKYALKLAKKGTLIVFDNVVRQGRVISGEGELDVVSKAMRDTFEFLKGEKRVECTALQTVGPKGWDGFAVARVVD